jgi:hypothetical protein
LLPVDVKQTPSQNADNKLSLKSEKEISDVKLSAVDLDRLSKEYNLDDIVDVLSNRLELIVAQANVQKPIIATNNIHSYSIFQSKALPSMTISEYFHRLKQWVLLRTEQMAVLKKVLDYKPSLTDILISTMIYIDRFAKSFNGFPGLNAFTIHRVIAASLVLACKYQSDFIPKNDWIAKVAGMTNKELNVLEVELLDRLNANLYVTKEEYNVYESEIYESLQAKKRGLYLSV